MIVNDYFPDGNSTQCLFKIENSILNRKNLGENKIEDGERSLVKVGLAYEWLKNQEYKELLLWIGVDQAKWVKSLKFYKEWVWNPAP